MAMVSIPRLITITTGSWIIYFILRKNKLYSKADLYQLDDNNHINKMPKIIVN